MLIANGSAPIAADSVTLFAFDDGAPSLPLRHLPQANLTHISCSTTGSLPNKSALRLNLVAGPIATTTTTPQQQQQQHCSLFTYPSGNRNNNKFPNPAFAQSDCRVLALGAPGQPAALYI